VRLYTYKLKGQKSRSKPADELSDGVEHYKIILCLRCIADMQCSYVAYWYRSHICMVCLSECWTPLNAVQKWLNWRTCHLRFRLVCRPEEPQIRWGPDIDMGMGTFKWGCYWDQGSH